MSSVLKIGQTCLTAEETYDLLAPGPRQVRTAAALIAEQLFLDLRGQRRLRRMPVGDADCTGQAQLA